MTDSPTSALRLTALEVFAPDTKPTAETRLCGPIDLTVAPGEHVLIVGPSGCGKTSLLRAIAGLSRHTRGRIDLFGQPATDGGRHVLDPEQRGLGYLFQGAALWPHMSVERTLAFTLRAGGVPSAERPERIRDLIARMGLVGLESRRPAQLSGGEGQRLGLARALALRPRLLLLDEPLGPLDAPLRATMLEHIKTLAAEYSLTILHVTHDPTEAHAAASRTLTLRMGRLHSDEVHA